MIMYFKRIVTSLAVQIALIVAFSAGAFAQGLMAPGAAQIDQNVTAALNNLYAQNDAAKTLRAKAKAVLVFPDIKKAAFIAGAQYGYGALRKDSQTLGYYRTRAASYGFQAGVKQFGYALFFMTDAALDYLDKSGGFAIGTGPSVVVVDEGFARSITTTSLRSDIYAIVFDQKGLMGGMGIEGSRIVRITPK
jgi:lipid-binding SYLF domain-containing protein